MTDRITETAAQVAAEIPRFSWELMDEEQRDDLMEKVVLPRYMKETVDGVTLGPSWWAEALGATDSAITNRVYRLRKKDSQESDIARSDEPTATQKGDIRGARSAVRKHPDLAAELVKDPEVRESVLKALDTDRPTRSTPVGTSDTKDRQEQLQLLHEFRRLHITVDRIARQVVDGHAVVNEEEREALLEEVQWLRSALDHIESGLSAGSLDKALTALLEG